MIEILKENYNLTISQYKPYNEGIIFYLNGFYYYFTICYLEEEKINDLILFIDKIKTISFHTFISNKRHQFLTNNYVLLRLNTLITEITIKDIYNFNSIKINEYNSQYLFMDELWEQKIDYFESQISELSNNKLINTSFDYFVGLSETIIKFYKNNFHKNKNQLVLSHQTMKSLSTVDFYNPLHLSYDYYLKDIASFIKLTKDEALLLNTIEQLNSSDKCYLFVRIIFPFNYFKEVENILINESSEHNLVNIINNIPKYELFLKNMEKYFGFNVFYWIKKE